MSVISAIVKLIKETLMSLHDTDKNNPRRNKPSLNAPDLNKNPLAAGTTQAQNSIDTPQADGLKIKERQIIAVQDGFNKAAFGFYGTANKFGFKVAQDGKDVLTADDSELVFNSEQNVFKIVDVVPMTLTVAASGSYYGSTTRAHNLGYVPGILPFITLPSSISGNNPNLRHGNPGMVYGLVGGVFRVFALAEVTIDSTNVYFSAQIDGSVGAGNYTFIANTYLLQETFA